MTAPAATYQRTVRASIDRVWENVLDWEHLPWLHRTTFAHVRPRTHGRDGWTAESALAWAPGETFLFEVVLDRSGLLYHSRTIAGAGTGTDIVTHLSPLDPHTTAIAVDFFVPAHAGQGYVALYTRLWDEDDAMMQRRQAVLDGTLPVECLPPAIAAGGPPDGLGFSAVCPHLGGPLGEARPDAQGCITCPWHGYRFDPRTGASADGRRLRLEPAPTAR